VLRLNFNPVIFICPCDVCSVIQAKCNPQMVLTVSMKQRRQSTSALPDGTTPLTSYVGCPCSLQRLKTTQFGRANQRWMLDRNTGLIYAFYTHTNDKGIFPTCLLFNGGINYAITECVCSHCICDYFVSRTIHAKVLMAVRSRLTERPIANE
jgi:hypothetical protein